ncbi:MAG: 50S ribosomal protein L32 [Candidatus Melainabacteria bacterium]|jgi:large subunit ribosomal protein L32|nr:50S ribosomal protein L32 [Cyanobacteria bacterium REEB446]MEB3315107.1 50S ribosomal protein L32 [Candidatus Melainabacteria bacterium]NBV99048.1 50S ribosomal protein L32 [Pseudomonadota bacterium]
MAVPKKNHSHQRQQQRRANWKGKLPNVIACNNCGSNHLAHNICPSCGYYNGRKYVEIAKTGS